VRANHGGATRLLGRLVHHPEIGHDHEVAEIVAVLGRILADITQAAGHDHHDIGVADAAFRRHLDQPVAESPAAASGLLSLKLGAALLEAVEMVVEPEEPAVPDRGNVIGQVRMEEALVEDRNARLVERHVFALEI
jgi:hypothetical protein